MRAVILTKTEYRKFILETVKPYIFLDEQNTWNITIIDETMPYFLPEYDVGISFMWTKKVPAQEVNSHPWFNFHPAPLPEYKGRDLCYHAIMNGERRFGATIHYMDEGFDTGDIIEVRRFSIASDFTAEDVHDVVIAYSKQLFSDYFPRILETPVFPRIPNRGGTYYKKGKILEEVPVRPHDPFGQFVRAVTYKDFHPRIDIGGVKYKIVREE